MNHGQQTQQDRQALPPIVYLLFSLAATAEIASSLPDSVRRAVLAILWRAERVAYSYVYWKMHDCGLSLAWGFPDECRQHSDADAALMLGCWFRVLAVALRDLPRRALVAEKVRMGWRVDAAKGRPAIRFEAANLQAPDTS